MDEKSLELELAEWDGTHFRKLFGWRGAFIGKRVFAAFTAENRLLRVWTKLPPEPWERAMDLLQARPHPLGFRNWLELQVESEADVDTILPHLHAAYEWVRDGEKLP